MNRKQYRKIAKMHKTTVKEVKSGIAEAVDYAYKKPNPLARSISANGEKPTVDEFVGGMTLEVQKSLKKK